MLRLKEERIKHKMTQEQVAQFLGLSRGAYANIENEKRQCDIEVYIRLADLYNISVDYLLGRSNIRTYWGDKGGIELNRLKELRENAGLTQAKFGSLFNASQNTVSNWEKGNRRIDNERLVQFSKYFGVSVEYLLNCTDDPQKTAKSDQRDALFLKMNTLSDSQIKMIESLVNVMSAENQDKHGN